MIGCLWESLVFIAESIMESEEIPDTEDKSELDGS